MEASYFVQKVNCPCFQQKMVLHDHDKIVMVRLVSKTEQKPPNLKPICSHTTLEVKVHLLIGVQYMENIVGSSVPDFFEKRIVVF